MKTLTVSTAFAGALIVGCGESKEGSRTVFSREILSAEEIAKAATLNAYDAVRRRRREFLRPRVPDSLDVSGSSALLPVVYVNGLYHGEAESPRNIPVRNVWEIRHLDTKEASLKYGTGHVAGVVEVTTKINYECLMLRDPIIAPATE